MKIRINNADIAYDDHGVGQPILFLHAFPLNRSMWQGQITALLNEQRFRLVALDWRGFGESESNTTLSTMELLADDVAALMDALGMQQAILCGLSLGGYVSFAFLRKYPERVKGLILADTKPDADTEEGKANRERIAQLAQSEGPDAVADLQVPKLLSDYTRQHHPEVEARVRRMVEAATGSGIAAVSRGMAQRTDAHDLLAQISVPALVLAGEQDVLTPPTLAQEYAAHISGSQFVVIPQAGHLSNLEQPEAFFEAIHDFLQASL
ncbi:MAG: alpha/beta fold hydrolase [Ktedonobacteraceae bacterium]|nr:alpha/beta fold hydrolase [Ktedonobacteraceae bacterium]